MRISDWSSDVCSSDLADRLAADTADRRAHEQRRRRWDRWWNGALAGFALLVPIAGGYGYYLGNGAGEAQGYARARDGTAAARSEEHTSELQSLMRISYAVFCLKKKKNNINIHIKVQKSTHIT